MSGWLPPGCTDKDIDDAAQSCDPASAVQCDNCHQMFDPDEDGCFIGFHKSFGDCCQCARCVQSEPGSEAQQLGEWMDRTEARVEAECKRGHRVSMMLMIERIIADNKLDRFPKEAAE